MSDDLQRKLEELEAQLASLELLRQGIGEQAYEAGRANIENQIVQLHQIQTGGGAVIGRDVCLTNSDVVGRDQNKLRVEGNLDGTAVVGDHNITNVYYQTYRQVEGQPVLSEHAFQQFLTNYLTWVANYYNRARLFGLERLGVNDHRPSRSLRDVFIPISLCRIKPPRKEEVEEQLGRNPDQDGLERIKIYLSLMSKRQQRAESIALNDLLVTGSRLAVIGGPGSGKSTLLNYLAVCLAQHIRGESSLPFRLRPDQPPPVPLVIPLRGYSEYRHLCKQSLQRSLDEPHLGTLTGYILYSLNHYGGRMGNFTTDGFERLMLGGCCLIMLDGLDEIVDRKERGRVREEVESLADGYPGNQFLVTAREAGYQENAVFSDRFTRLDVQPLQDEQIRELIANWCVQLYPGEEIAKRDEISTAISEINACRSDTDLQPLVASPLMVTMVVGVKWSRAQLPRERAKLYDAAVEVILQLQHTQDDMAREQLTEWGGTLDEQREWLWTLAFEMHRGGKAGAAVSMERIRDVLLPGLGETAFARFIETVHERGGLLEERAGLYQFTHLTFQEFLAARCIVDRRLGKVDLSRFVGDPWWREVLLLAYGYAVYAAPAYARDLLNWLSDLPGDTQLAGVELAAAAVLEIEKPNPALRLRQAQRLVNVLTNPDALFQPKQRAQGGNTLAELGDPRFHVKALYLPDEPMLGFVEIPAGPFLMGSDPQMDQSAQENEQPQHIIDIPAFWIARYPVTVAQYRTFVDDSGYQTRDPDSLRGTANHPVVWVTWHDSLAYCEWLMNKLLNMLETPVVLRELLKAGGKVQLPSEVEWEKAARGTDGRLYPWGNQLDTRKGNLRETGIKGTSAVGCLPGGISPYQLHDMSGNVWEWTSSEFKDYTNHLKNGFEDQMEIVHRVRRGCSWGSNQKYARCAVRQGYNPNYMNHNIGFRVAILHFPTPNVENTDTLSV